MISERQVLSKNLHSGGHSEMDLRDTTLLIIVHECSLLVYNAAEERVVLRTPLDAKMRSIACHPLNPQTFAIGATRVEVYDEVEMINPRLIAFLQGSINQIKYSHNGRYIGITSEENQLTLFASESGKVSKCRPGHDGMTLSCIFDPKDRYVASIGCDGCCIIYQLSDPPKLLKRYTISGQISFDGFQNLKGSWHPTGEFVCFSGKTNLQYAMTEDECGDLQISYQTIHSDNISIIEWIKPHAFVTSSLDGEFKLWHFQTFIDITCHWKINLNTTALSIRVNLKNFAYILDRMGNLHSIQLELPLTDYEKTYSSKENALQDLLNLKAQKLYKKRGSKRESSDSEPDVQKQINDYDSKRSINKNISVNNNSRMQNILQVGQSPFSKGRRYLCYNNIGSIIQCSLTNIIEFDFHDFAFHRKFKLDNAEKHYSLATMNIRGCLLASKGPNDVDENGYAVSDTSTIYFEHFLPHGDSFQISLPAEEGVELIALGSHWLAAWTDANLVRIFSLCGLPIWQLQTTRPPLTLAGYEHHLALVHHHTAPIFNQVLQLLVYDINTHQLVVQTDVALSPMSTLKTFGYSQEGLLYTQDSKGITRIFLQNQWITVLSEDKYYLYAIQDYKLHCLRAEEPIPTVKLQVTTFDFEIPVISGFSENEKISKAMQSLQLRQVIYEHELIRWNYFGQLYHARKNFSDPLKRLTQNMYDENKLNDLLIQMRKLRIDLFSYVLSISVEKGVEFFRFFIDQEIERNQIFGMLEKQSKNEAVARCLEQLKVIAKQQILLKSNAVIPNQPPSPQKQGFGLQRPVKQKFPMPNQEQQYQEPISQIPQIQLENEEIEEELLNPFANLAQKQMTTIFDMNEGKSGGTGIKRKPQQQIFGSQNLKKKT